MSAPEAKDLYAEAVRLDVEARMTPIKKEAEIFLATWKEQADGQAKEFQNETDELLNNARETFRDSKHRLNEIEDGSRDRILQMEKDVTAQVQSKATSIASIIVGGVVAAVVGLTFLATKDLYSSVSALQTTVIQTQATIKQADKDLADESKMLTAASNAVAVKMAELNLAEGKLNAATVQLDKAQSDLEKVRGEFHALAKR